MYDIEVFFKTFRTVYKSQEEGGRIERMNKIMMVEGETMRTSMIDCNT